MIELPDSNALLYVKPIFNDLAIQYLVLTEPIRDYAIKKGYNVIALEGENARPEAVSLAISQHDPLFVFSSGHGCPNVHTLVDYEDVMWVSPGCSDHSHADSNIKNLSGRVTHLLSCYCGQRLIPAIVDAGGKTAIGYSDEFLWVVDVDSPVREDPFAITFFDCPNYFMSLILDGINFKEAYDRTVERYRYWIDYWNKWLDENPKAEPYYRSRAMLSISLLEHDRDVMTLRGEDINIAGAMKIGVNIPITLLLLAIIANYLFLKWKK